jgi:WD40 repeat protein
VDARTLVSCGADGLIRIWSLPPSIDVGYDVTESRLNGVKVSPDGRNLLCTSPTEYSVVDAKTGDVLVHRRDSVKDFCALAWAPSGDKAAVCCRNPGTVFLLSPSGQELRSIESPDHVHAITFSPDGLIIAIIGEKRLQLSRTDSGQTVFQQELDKSGISTAFSHDGTRLAYGGKLGKIIVLDCVKLHPERELDCSNEAQCMVFSPDDRLLATGHSDSMIRIWEVKTGRLQAELVGHERGLHDLAFSPDGRTLLSAADDGTIRVWSVDHGRAYGVFYKRFDAGARQFDCHLDLPTDGSYLAVGYGTDKPKSADVYLWRLDATDVK